MNSRIGNLMLALCVEALVQKAYMPSVQAAIYTLRYKAARSETHKSFSHTMHLLSAPIHNNSTPVFTQHCIANTGQPSVPIETIKAKNMKSVCCPHTTLQADRIFGQGQVQNDHQFILCTLIVVTPKLDTPTSSVRLS